MQDVSIHEHSPGLYIVGGVVVDKSCQLYFTCDELALAELVRIKKVGSGTFEISFMEYLSESSEWVAWHGCATTSISALTPEMRLGRRILKAREAQPDSAAQNRSGQRVRVLLSESSFLEAGKVFMHCYDCRSDVLRENFAIHAYNVHGYTPIGDFRKLVGRLLRSENPSKKFEVR